MRFRFSYVRRVGVEPVLHRGADFEEAAQRGRRVAGELEVQDLCVCARVGVWVGASWEVLRAGPLAVLGAGALAPACLVE